MIRSRVAGAEPLRPPVSDPGRGAPKERALEGAGPGLAPSSKPYGPPEDGSS